MVFSLLPNMAFERDAPKALFSIMFCVALLTVRHVNHFLAYQTTNRNPYLRRVLQVLLLVAGMPLAIQLIVDITRILQ